MATICLEVIFWAFFGGICPVTFCPVIFCSIIFSECLSIIYLSLVSARGVWGIETIFKVNYSTFDRKKQKQNTSYLFGRNVVA